MVQLIGSGIAPVEDAAFKCHMIIVPSKRDVSDNLAICWHLDVLVDFGQHFAYKHGPL